MADIIKCVNKAEADDLIKKLKKENFELVLASAVLKPKKFPKIHTTAAKFLVPNAMIINTYLETGNQSMYKESYIDQLRRPEIWWFINIMMDNFFSRDITIVFACAEVEREYKYLKYLKEFIENTYNVKIISCDKFFKGKHTKFDEKELSEKITLFDKMLVNKLKDVGISPMELFASFIDDETYKNLPKDIKKKLSKYNNYE